MTDVIKPSVVEWGIASQPIDGQAVSGDSALVKQFANGVLLAAIDGLGHGDEACLVSQQAVAVLDSIAREPVVELVRRCHARLARTRGAAMALASVDTHGQAMTWLGVGNVEGILMRPDGLRYRGHSWLLLRSGVVGYQLPSLQPTTVALEKGDLLILATDGIDAAFGDSLSTREPAQQIANSILRRHFKGTDDALVLAARYLGPDHA